MASSRPSSNQPDMEDLAAAWAFLESVNQATITIAMGMAMRGATLEPLLNAIAWDAKEENGDQPALALANVRCWAFGHRTVESALLHLLYTLDGQIAKEEFAREGNKRA